MLRCTFRRVFCIAANLALLAGAASAEPRADTPSGLPVPRFVSLKYDKTLCRQGPSFEHPVAFTFMRAGLPVLVTAETRDHWRKITDLEGARCWAHQTTLRATTHAILLRDVDLRLRPTAKARVAARVEKGVVARLGKRRGDWRRIEASGLEGWAPADSLWGAAAVPPAVAAHN